MKDFCNYCSEDFEYLDKIDWIIHILNHLQGEKYNLEQISNDVREIKNKFN